MDSQVLAPERARDGGRPLIAVAAAIAVVVLAIAAWRLAIQRVNLVIVNQSGVAAHLTRQPSLFGAMETMLVGGCESTSMTLSGGQGWRLQADGLDVNQQFVDRPWLTSMVELEIWLDAGRSSRIVGPRPIEKPVDAPSPSACVVLP